MSKIEYKDEGKHGTITNGAGQTLTGKVSFIGSWGFDLLIDNNKSSNRFNLAEWDFVPDKVMIPTKLMAVIKLKNSDQNNVFVKTEVGWWSKYGLMKYEDERIRKWADRDGLDILFEGIA